MTPGTFVKSSGTTRSQNRSTRENKNIAKISRFKVEETHNLTVKCYNALLIPTAFLLISSIMLMKYTVNEKKREELKENRLNKLKAHKGTWLLLIMTLMFEHYQLATW